MRTNSHDVSPNSQTCKTISSQKVVCASISFPSANLAVLESFRPGIGLASVNAIYSYGERITQYILYGYKDRFRDLCCPVSQNEQESIGTNRGFCKTSPPLWKQRCRTGRDSITPECHLQYGCWYDLLYGYFQRRQVCAKKQDHQLSSPRRRFHKDRRRRCQR